LDRDTALKVTRSALGKSNERLSPALRTQIAQRSGSEVVIGLGEMSSTGVSNDKDLGWAATTPATQAWFTSL
jgi:hypothetical protein